MQISLAAFYVISQSGTLAPLVIVLGNCIRSIAIKCKKKKG